MDPANQYFIAATVGVIFSTLSFLALSKRQRKIYMDRMPSWLVDPLPSLLATPSPEPLGSSSLTSSSLKSPAAPPSNVPAPTGYKDTLPPSARECLFQAAELLPQTRRQLLRGSPIDGNEFRKNLIPFTADYRECGSSSYTPTEISVGEVKALGDFPDYAALGGVPLPKPYREFCIERAITRPYRPFRWPYHQNMCMSLQTWTWI